MLVLSLNNIFLGPGFCWPFIEVEKGAPRHLRVRSKKANLTKTNKKPVW